MFLRLGTIVTVALLLAACGPGYRPTPPNAAPVAQQTGVVRSVDWPALSQWRKSNEAPNDVAVIVAIEDYAFLPDIPGASRNAADWESWFRSRGMKDVFVLTNNNAASEEMLRYAEAAAKATTSQSRLWYVFIGHGAPATDGKDGVLVGMDARQTPDSLTSRGVRQGELLARLEKGEQQQTIMVVDACFSGRSGDGESLAPGTQPVLALAPASNVATNTVVLSAAQPDQFAGSLPGAQRPAYSYLLLGALGGWADDGDGNLTAGDAHDYVTRQLRHVTGRTQTPDISGRRDLFLTANARVADPGVADRMAAAAAGPVQVAAGPAGMQIDTGGGVLVTQVDGWVPDSVETATTLTSFRYTKTNNARWFLLGWRDPNGDGARWMQELHAHYQGVEKLISPTRRIRFGDLSWFETSYQATYETHPITIHVWDFPRSGAYYRAIGLSFNSDQFGDEDYAAFTSLVQSLQFTSPYDAPRLLDGTPGLLNKMSN